MDIKHNKIDKKQNKRLNNRLHINMNVIYGVTKYMRRRGRPQPPSPEEPVPSVPPVGEADGDPLRYGGLRAASAPTIHCHFNYYVRISFIICVSIVTLLSLAAVQACRPERSETAFPATAINVKPGVEVFLEKHLDLVRGKNVGLITNPTGVSRDLESTADLFFRHADIHLVALYGPEHGVRGNAQAGEYVPLYLDEKYAIPVFSLYGQSEKPVPGMLKDIDKFMRTFDTKDAGKMPESSMIEDIDVLIFDIQDVGTRIYTYVATMAYAMQACAENGISFIVLDRPNPINGVNMEGPVLEYPEFSSFVGLYPVPLRHGMTAGELARLFNERFLEKRADLTVIPMEGWQREMWFDETSLPWVIPSPNMPALSTATVYPGQVFFEGTNVSEGRGTTKPFEFFGAPWIDGYELVRKLNSLSLSGVRFREAWFTPTFSKFAGELCGGAQIHVTDRRQYQPWETSLHIIKTIRDIYPAEFKFHISYFDKIMGTTRVREALETGIAVPEIAISLSQELEQFAALRKPFLLY